MVPWQEKNGLEELCQYRFPVRVEIKRLIHALIKVGAEAVPERSSQVDWDGGGGGTNGSAGCEPTSAAAGRVSGLLEFQRTRGRGTFSSFPSDFVLMFPPGLRYRQKIYTECHFLKM